MTFATYQSLNTSTWAILADHPQLAVNRKCFNHLVEVFCTTVLSLPQYSDLSVEVFDLFIFLLAICLEIGIINVENFYCYCLGRCKLATRCDVSLDSLVSENFKPSVDSTEATLSDELVESISGSFLVTAFASFSDRSLLGFGKAYRFTTMGSHGSCRLGVEGVHFQS